jgi:hypothetical protein
MSEFVFLFRSSAEAQRAAMGTPEQAQQSLQKWLAWLRELQAGGHLKDRGQPLAPGGAVVRGADKVVTDGPFVEAKDLVLGFNVIEARDLDQALELASRCPIVEGGGAVEIRPVDQEMTRVGNPNQ